MERIEDCISFLAGKAAQQVARRARALLAPLGVTPLQYAVLKVVGEAEGTSGADLGARLRLDSASITGVVDRLEAQELLYRRDDRQDRRIHRLFLTERGRGLLPALDAAMDRLNAEALAMLGPEATRVLAGLERLGQARDRSEDV